MPQYTFQSDRQTHTHAHRLTDGDGLGDNSTPIALMLAVLIEIDALIITQYRAENRTWRLREGGSYEPPEPPLVTGLYIDWDKCIKIYNASKQRFVSGTLRAAIALLSRCCSSWISCSVDMIKRPCGVNRFWRRLVLDCNGWAATTLSSSFAKASSVTFAKLDESASVSTDDDFFTSPTLFTATEGNGSQVTGSYHARACWIHS